MTCIDPIHQGDSLAVLVPVTDELNAPARKDITGATISAGAVDIHGNPTAASSVTATNPVQGEITVVFNKGVLTIGRYRLQVYVDLGSEAQQVIEEKFTVKPAYFP
jgi:hypothetical protein